MLNFEYQIFVVFCMLAYILWKKSKQLFKIRHVQINELQKTWNLSLIAQLIFWQKDSSFLFIHFVWQDHLKVKPIKLVHNFSAIPNWRVKTRRMDEKEPLHLAEENCHFDVWKVISSIFDKCSMLEQTSWQSNHTSHYKSSLQEICCKCLVW